jgi:hypothetical protein
MKPKPWLLICVGMLIGVLISGFGYFFVRMSEGFAMMGALQYETDATVRSRVKKAGIRLPPEAYDIHCGFAGFVDHSRWIKFTVPKDEIWNVVGASISKSEKDFLPRMPEHLLKEVDQESNQTFDLSWWTPFSVTSPLSWSRTEGRIYDDWLIDKDSGTFYITRWDY